MRYIAAVWAVLFWGPAVIQGNRLPIRTYTTAEGLARDHILCIVQDSHGFLWFCTSEGLSRFDGYQFTNYRTDQGLPSNAVLGLLETREGDYWIATQGGLVRFDPAGTAAARFHFYPLHANEIPRKLLLDRAGRIWCGTSQAVIALPSRSMEARAASQRVDIPAEEGVTALLGDRRGILWIGTSNGLFRREPDGRMERYGAGPGMPNDYIMALAEDGEGRLWIGTRKGLLRMDQPPAAHQPLGARLYTEKDGLPGQRIESLLNTAAGTLWVGTNQGLAEWLPSVPAGVHQFQSYTLAQGLTARAVGALAEDRDGNLWIGTFGSGAMKVAHSGFTTFTESDGAYFTAALVESRSGEMCLVYRIPGSIKLARFDGRRFVAVQPRWPFRSDYWGWGRGQMALQDRNGEWWIGTGRGLARFAAVRSVAQLDGLAPKAVYTTRDGLPGDDIFCLFEDSRGDIWIGTIGGEHDGLARWDRASGKFHVFAGSEGLPPKPLPTAMAEDRAGDIWISLYHDRTVARYRAGAFTLFRGAEVPGFVHALFTDSQGRLWIGTSGGLVGVADPPADRPHLVTYGVAQGLSSDDVVAMTEDRLGRIYAATGRGIDRFEPRGDRLARMTHYTTADGIAPGELDLAFSDSHGRTWFTTPLGVSQFVPPPDRQRTPPPVLVTGFSVGGVPHPVSDLGETALAGLRLPSSPLRVDFVGLGFSPGEALRYQYMLEGADRDWSAPTDQRSVVFARLPAGSYRFLVRAVASDGTASAQPASIAFTIPPPVWRSWWFIAAVLLATGLAGYSLHRMRVARLLAVANVRTRIATDLHDDIGASLSQIAILSEVAQRATGSKNGTPFSEIAGISRGLVDSLSDIVWAINPEHDRLRNLAYRIRRFATDLLGGQGMHLEFHFSVADQDLRIGADIRRQVYLILKEAIHNIARHSGATRVEVELDRAGDQLELRVSDNGKGFDAAAQYEGQGLKNMRRRAQAAGGSTAIESAPGRGTTLTITVRLESSRVLAVLRGKE